MLAVLAVSPGGDVLPLWASSLGKDGLMSNRVKTGKPRGNPNWRKGVSGNPGGKPRRVVCLAETIREELSKRGLMQDVIAKIVALALEPHDWPMARIAAANWLASHGWPNAKDLASAIDVTPVKVPVIKHVHLPERSDPALPPHPDDGPADG